jgi:hypothetical protein
MLYVQEETFYICPIAAIHEKATFHVADSLNLADHDRIP